MAVDRLPPSWYQTRHGWALALGYFAVVASVAFVSVQPSALSGVVSTPVPVDVYVYCVVGALVWGLATIVDQSEADAERLRETTRRAAADIGTARDSVDGDAETADALDAADDAVRAALSAVEEGADLWAFEDRVEAAREGVAVAWGRTTDASARASLSRAADELAEAETVARDARAGGGQAVRPELWERGEGVEEGERAGARFEEELAEEAAEEAAVEEAAEEAAVEEAAERAPEPTIWAGVAREIALRPVAALPLAAGVYLLSDLVAGAVGGQPPPTAVAVLALFVGLFLYQTYGRLGQIADSLQPAAVDREDSLELPVTRDRTRWYRRPLGRVLIGGYLVATLFVLWLTVDRPRVPVVLPPVAALVPVDVYLYGLLGATGRIFTELTQDRTVTAETLALRGLRLPAAMLLAGAVYLVVAAPFAEAPPFAVAGLAFLVGLYEGVAFDYVAAAGDRLFPAVDGGGDADDRDAGDG